MNKATLIFLMVFIISSVYCQKTTPSLILKANQRNYISGVAPTATIEFGEKEKNPPIITNEPEYFIYLIANKIPSLKIERIWIKQQLYIATIHKVANKPVVLQNGKKRDTLVKYTDEVVWQINITGKDNSSKKPKNDIAAQVKSNELFLRLYDLTGKVYTRTLKHINVLDAERGQ